MRSAVVPLVAVAELGLAALAVANSQTIEPLAKFIERGEFPSVRGAERLALRPARA